ncbi:hypothetical protein SmJEL517_g04729 [Synchytrium microbalum]|uniref:cAMP-dependent protein kinase n=1 Tax=Synchytrium microbalum TaxID=1806994 RepID=A0A507BXI4_9FUNG|nr:uncharacterized protein SmJEL517_g04729 [Synchytrium microbalum]TPX32142.1 hypothetical protein SmJEL517_g04729 [Synchytrium microbalum]
MNGIPSAPQESRDVANRVVKVPSSPSLKAQASNQALRAANQSAPSNANGSSTTQPANLHSAPQPIPWSTLRDQLLPPLSSNASPPQPVMPAANWINPSSPLRVPTQTQPTNGMSQQQQQQQQQQQPAQTSPSSPSFWHASAQLYGGLFHHAHAPTSNPQPQTRPPSVMNNPDPIMFTPPAPLSTVPSLIHVSSRRQSDAMSVEDDSLARNQQHPNHSFQLSDFQIMNTLGTGSFGRVHLVQELATKEYRALKVMKKSEVVRLKQVEHTINEKTILEQLRHPFLVHLYGTFQDSQNLYLVLDYIPGGELFTYLRKSGRFPTAVARYYAAQVVLAFEFLHDREIIYRDLKPENLLIDSKGNIKITDFGFAKYVPDVTWTLCGTPDYLAPEIIQAKGYGKAVDWWALGVLLYEMIAGHPPFYDEDHFKLYEKILAGKLRFPIHFDGDAKDLVRRLLTADLTRRFGNLRGGAADIKAHKFFAGVDWKSLVEGRIAPPFIPKSSGPADTSNFDTYPEDYEPYGQQVHDPFKDKFTVF